MPTHLKIVAGPHAGTTVPLAIGKTITIGRTKSKSMLELPLDQHLSGQHFSAGLRNGLVYLCHLSKTNPTELNGENIQTAVLKVGDKFKAGESVFEVVAPDNPHPAEFRLGGWGFQNIPQGWTAKEGNGLRYAVTDPFQPNLIAIEESIPAGYDLAKYVALQISLGKQHLKEATFGEPKTAQVVGAECALALVIHAASQKGPALQYQIYALHSGVVGVVTTTALESQSNLLQEAMRQILPGLTFFQG